MKFLRIASLIVLAVALAGFFAGDAEAAFIDSVKVVTPTDTVAYRGIDSLIVTDVYLGTGGSTADSSIAVFAWLATNGTATDFLADGTTSAIEDSIMTDYFGSSVGGTGGSAITTPTDKKITAVRAPIAKGFTGAIGDADSVVFRAGPDRGFGASYIARIYSKITGANPDKEKVTVYATVFDETAKGSQSAPDGFVAAKFATTYKLHIDGDRPFVDTTKVHLTSIDPLGERFVTGFKTNASDPSGHPGGDPFDTDADKRVLGIGDSVQVNYDLGTAFQDIKALDLSVSAQLVYAHPKVTQTINLGGVKKQVDKAYVVIAEDAFPNVADTTSYGEVRLFLTDPAGNLSAAGATKTAALVDGPAVGLTTSASFVVDAKVPTLDTTDDDLIIPANNDTITDGGINNGTSRNGAYGYLRDKNPLTYKLDETLSKLEVVFDNTDDALDRTYVIPALTAGTTSTAGANGPTALDDDRLGRLKERAVDLTKGVSTAGKANLTFEVYNTTDKTLIGGTAAAISSGVSYVKDGVYSVKFKGTDLAGNVSTQLARTNVYVDVTDIDLKDLFPTKIRYGHLDSSRTDTIEEVTAQVSFTLSEPADSAIIMYKGLVGPDIGQTRTRRLAGSELTSTSLQTFPVEGLVDLTTYELTVLARDLAGNYTLSGPDTFLYDTSFVVPIIQRFTIASSHQGILAANHVLAGQEITLTLTADASPDGKRDAVTYKGNAILKVDARNSGGVLTSVTGTGVTDLGNGRIQLDSKTWLAGKRTVTLKDSSAIDTLAVSIVDSSDATKPYVGKLDSLIVYDPNAYTKIVVSAPATVTQGEEFQVDVTIADKYGNRRTADDRYVGIAANKLGIEIPQGDLFIDNGMGHFMAKAAGWSGEGLSFRVYDLIDARLTPSVDITNNEAIRDGASAAIAVTPAGDTPVDPTAPLDAPDELIAEDYMGADGLGDQGGFVLLTWDLSADHSTVTAYRIYREMMVNYGVGDDGALVMLEAPALAWVPWGKVDAVPGEDVGRAVVATLDNVATHWAIAAERGRQTTAKEAFDGVEAVATPYELMAETLVESKKAAAQVDGPVFATLTPEALAFVETGVVPRMKSVDVVAMSPKTPTVEAVRAIDNIAPAAVPYLRAMDTPNDMGSSITVLWTKSESDRMLPRSVPNAIGISLADQVAGVQGYNIYRKVGDGEFSLVGKAGPGETSFQDLTALNGVRYTYQVRPYDLDNETEALFERSALSIRNNAVDASGQPVYGLFGVDTKVGFDDFFVFADNFGLSAADEIFEPAFDLVANAKVDFEDFFAFADNFGRQAVAAGKVVPTMAGLNADARLYLDAGADLPKIGEEVAIDVSLADFVELKGYGFSVDYDADLLEFVKVVTDNSLLGEGELAQPTVISQTDGQVAIAAYGEKVSEGDLGMSLVFRTKTEIENTYVEVMESDVQDGSYAVNPVALPAPVQIQTRPEQYALGNNYPNPFNPATTLKYALPEAGFVKLEIYNVVGQVVRTLVAGQQNAGRYVVQWDASDDSGRSLSSGIYFYRLQAGGEFLEVKKMLLLK